MTTDRPDDRADVIEAAAARVITMSLGPGRKWNDMKPRDFARALSDAGLLATPADQCHVVGCVEHVDGMHVDHVGDAIVHIGCPACRERSTSCTSVGHTVPGHEGRGACCDLADRDNTAEDLCSKLQVSLLRARFERAEAEVERLKADLREARRHTDQAWDRVKYWRDSELPAARAEADLLHAQVAAVRSVCQNTDGDWLDGESEIPVGEVLRMLTLDGRLKLDTAGGEQP